MFLNSVFCNRQSEFLLLYCTWWMVLLCSRRRALLRYNSGFWLYRYYVVEARLLVACDFRRRVRSHLFVILAKNGLNCNTSNFKTLDRFLPP